MTTYRLFPSTNGPAASIVTSNNDIFNTSIAITSWGNWLDGYWWWRADSAQPSGAQKFCLWQVNADNVGTLIPASVVTSSTAFTVGAWNYIPLTTPINLSVGQPYRLATGLTGNFPFTSGFWGTGGPGVGGIVSGPLTAYSDVAGNGGTKPEPFGANQSVFSSSNGNDPTTTLVGTGSSSFNAWIDAQIDSIAPLSATYRLFPNLPVPETQSLDTATNFTLGLEFSLSQSCALNKVWFYSPATVTQLPTEVGIFSTNGNALVASTHQTSPSWSGVAASGWVSVSYSGVTLPAGQYKLGVLNGAVTPVVWNTSTAQYWSTGPGGSGIANGPLSAPSNAGATSPGQSSYHQGASLTFPDTNTGPFNYWIDVEVTPIFAPIPSELTGTLIASQYAGTLTAGN